MNYRALLPAALILSLGAASAAPSAFVEPAGPAVVVRAGVGGAARPGRWLPVDIAVTTSDTAFRGFVSVTWGGAVTQRDLDLGPSSTSRMTLLVRTIAALPAVRVSVHDATGAVAATSDAPIALLPVDDPATLCVGDAPADTRCDVRIPAGEAPLNWRGFDLADEVTWPDAEHTPSPEAARAYALWKAARWWQNSGFVDPVVAPFDAESRLADRTVVGLAVFVLALIVCLSAASWRRAGLLFTLGLPIAAAAGGVAVLTRSSRDVDIQAASFVHQFADEPRSIVLMKGEVEHPGADMVELGPNISDASVDIVSGAERAEGAASADGRAVYRSAAGRGVRQRFELNGLIDQPWLRVDTAADSVLIENRSPFDLADCQFRSTDVSAFGALSRGAAVRVSVPNAVMAGDSVVCRLPTDWMTWSAAGAAVSTRGSAFVIFHFWQTGTRAGAGANAAR